jgi:hypothetical protein
MCGKGTNWLQISICNRGRSGDSRSVHYSSGQCMRIGDLAIDCSILVVLMTGKRFLEVPRR